MNEELDGLVSLGIERGRNFDYIAQVLANEGYSKDEIALAKSIYTQKKKSQAAPTSGSAPQAASQAPQLAGPRISKQPSESGTGSPDARPYSELTSQAGALGALQYATTGVAPVSNQKKKELVSNIENVNTQLRDQQRASAQTYLDLKEQGVDPYKDAGFIAAKQRENELKRQKGDFASELFPEVSGGLVEVDNNGDYQETELFKAKYEPVAIATIPAIIDEAERAERERQKEEARIQGKKALLSGSGWETPLVGDVASGTLALGSGFIGLIADVTDFLTRFGANKDDVYEGLLAEGVGSVNDLAKYISSGMREQRQIAMENLGVSKESQQRISLELLLEGNYREGIPALAVNIGDAWMFSNIMGAMAGAGSVASTTVGAELESAILTANAARGTAGTIAAQLANNLKANVAESPVMFGTMAAVSAQQSWDSVKDDPNLTITEKIGLASVSTFANTLTEALNIDDLKLAAGSLNLDGAAREQALKSFKGTAVQYVKDMVQVGVPEAFEEALNYYTEALGNYIVKGEMPTVTEPAQAMLIGFLAPALNVSAVYAPRALESALKNTALMLPSTKKFLAEQELLKKKSEIVDALGDENIAKEERKVLEKSLADINAAIEEENRKDFEFYSTFEYADANEIVNLHGQIRQKATQYKKTRSTAAREQLKNEITELYNRKLEIERKYDSQAQTGVPSGVQEGASVKPAKSKQGTSDQTLETSGVLQTQEKVESTPEEEAARATASKDASETFNVAGIVPTRVISDVLASSLNKIFSSVKSIVTGGKVKLHYTQDSIANANEQTRSMKAKNPNVFFDGFFDKDAKTFHVYIPTGADTARIVKTEEGKYTVIDPKNGRTIKTFKDSQTAFKFKEAYDTAYIEYATGKARHEAIHPVIDVLIEEDGVDQDGNTVKNPHRTFLYESIVELYESNPAVKDIFNNFINAYVKVGSDSKTIEREVITEFLARMADEKTFKSLDKGFLQKVKDIINEMLVRAGVRDVSISTDDDLYRVARAFKTAMKLGKEIKIIQGKGRNYKPVGDPFKVEILNNLPESKMTQKQLEKVISSGKFGMLTTENPRGTRFPAEMNKRRHADGKAWLEERGYKPVDIVGKFEGIAENSFLVPNLTLQDAKDFAKEFSQEGIAHSSAFVNYDGSYSPRNLEADQYNVDHTKESNDYFSTIKLSDGKLSSFKLDYHWDVKLNRRAVDDGVTNPLDFALRLEDGQTYTEFFKSLEDETMMEQSAMIQLLAEKFGYTNEVVFVANPNETSAIEKDGKFIFNLSSPNALPSIFGFFANHISFFIARENMGLYQTMLFEMANRNKEDFNSRVEQYLKDYEFGLEGGYKTDIYEETEKNNRAFAEGQVARRMLNEYIAEYFASGKSDYKKMNQMWENTQTMLSKAFDVEFKDIYPATKVDNVLALMAATNINPRGGEFIKKVYKESNQNGSEFNRENLDQETADRIMAMTRASNASPLILKPEGNFAFLVSNEVGDILNDISSFSGDKFELANELEKLNESPYPDLMRNSIEIRNVFREIFYSLDSINDWRSDLVDTFHSIFSNVAFKRFLKEKYSLDVQRPYEFANSISEIIILTENKNGVLETVKEEILRSLVDLERYGNQELSDVEYSGINKLTKLIAGAINFAASNIDGPQAADLNLTDTSIFEDFKEWAKTVEDKKSRVIGEDFEGRRVIVHFEGEDYPGVIESTDRDTHPLIRFDEPNSNWWGSNNDKFYVNSSDFTFVDGEQLPQTFGIDVSGDINFINDLLDEIDGQVVPIMMKKSGFKGYGDRLNALEAYVRQISSVPKAERLISQVPFNFEDSLTPLLQGDLLGFLKFAKASYPNNSDVAAVALAAPISNELYDIVNRGLEKEDGFAEHFLRYARGGSSAASAVVQAIDAIFRYSDDIKGSHRFVYPINGVPTQFNISFGRIHQAVTSIDDYISNNGVGAIEVDSYNKAVPVDGYFDFIDSKSKKQEQLDLSRQTSNSRGIDMYIPKLDEDYHVSGSYYERDGVGVVNVAFSSTKTGYDLKPGAAMAVMPKVIEAISQMFPEKNPRVITFSALSHSSDKRSGNELRAGTYKMSAERLFRGFHMSVNERRTGDEAIAIPHSFTIKDANPDALGSFYLEPSSVGKYQRMVNKPSSPDNISFAIRNVESIPSEVTEHVNGIKGALAFASESGFPNKLKFKEALQDRFNLDAKKLKEKYGITSFKKFDEALKNYLVDAYINETLIAIDSYPDALGWYDYKTRAAMAIMSLIHPELKTDKDAQATFKIAVAVTSNGNKVFDNFKEANRQYEFFKKNGKFDSGRSIGTQSSGIKKTFELANKILGKMTMGEFATFLTSKHRAGDLKYVDAKGKKVALLSGFNVDTEVYGASIFGPKIGNGFFMNLYGKFDQLTMDRWFMRQYGRLTGTLLERDAAKIKKGADRLKSAKSSLSAAEKKAVNTVIPGYAKLSLEELATKINRASIDAGKRDLLSSSKALNELRLAGNSLEKLQTGEVEAPGGGNQRAFIIDVFNEVQKKMKDEFGIDITIADLQAVNWYPEKALYQTFQEGRTEATGAEETSDNEQPDYESAAKRLAISKGITETQITNATRGIQQPAVESGRETARAIGERGGRSIPELTQTILAAKGGVDFAIRDINWIVSPEGKGDPSISSRNAQLEDAIEDLVNGRITNEEFREISRLVSPVEPIKRFFAPATTERMKSALSKDKLSSLNAPVSEGTKVALRLDIPAYMNGNTWVVSIHDGVRESGKVISYRNVARIENVTFNSRPKAALAIARGAAKSTIGRMFGEFVDFQGNTVEEKAENAKQIVARIANDPTWVQVGMNPTRASYFYDRKSGFPIVAADEVIQIGGLVYAHNPKFTSKDDPRFIVDGLQDLEGKPVYFSMSFGGPEIQIEGKKIRQFADRMADSNIELYSDIVNNPQNYYTPQKLEEIKDRLTTMTVPELLNEMTSEKVLTLSSDVKVDMYDEDNVSILIGAELIKRYTEEGDTAKILDTIERMAKMGTTVGRMLRHYGEIKNATHAGMASMVVAMVAKAGRKLTDSQMVTLNALTIDLFNKQVAAKNLIFEAMRNPSQANDKEIARAEKELSIATKKLDDFVSTVVPKKYGDLFGAIMQGNLLTPVSQVFNVYGNIANVFARQFLVAPPAALIDAIRAFTSGKNREVTLSMGAFLFGVKRAVFMGIPESFSYMFLGRKPSDELFEYEYRRGFIPIQSMLAALSDTKVANAINKAVGREVIKSDQLARLESGEISLNDRLKKFTEATFGIPAEIMFRTLTLGDRPFSRFAEGLEIHRQARKLGLKGDAFAEFIKHPDPQTIKKAKEVGKEITYQADTSFSKAVQNILNALSKTELGGFLVKMVVPFSKTPSNIIYDTLNYVTPPLALARALKAAKQKDYAAFSTLISKSIIGFSLYAVADWLISNGLATSGIGDDEKKEKELFYSMFPYESINMSALRRVLNGGSSALQDGDVFVNYSKAGPIGAIIGARAAYWAGKDMKPTSTQAVSDGYAEMFTQYASDMIGTTMSSFQFMAQQSFLANTNQILELLNSKGEVNADYVLNSLFKTSSAIILPNTLSSLNRSTRAKLPDLYDKNSLFNSLINVVKDRTFNTDGIAVKVNIWGERVDQTPAGANPFFYNLFDPVRYQSKEYQPFQQEVFRLYIDLGQETGAIPTIPQVLNSRKFTDKDTEVQYYFTNEEVNNMLEVLGKERVEMMKDLIKQDWYQGYSDEDKVVELKYIYQDVTRNGRWKELYDQYVEKAKQENRLAK